VKPRIKTQVNDGPICGSTSRAMDKIYYLLFGLIALGIAGALFGLSFVGGGFS
jgi:hypothetical protein